MGTLKTEDVLFYEENNPDFSINGNNNIYILSLIDIVE